MSVVRTSKFRHVFGSPYKADSCFNGLKTEGSGDTNCAVSCKFFAMVKASKIFVVPLDKPGRQEENNMFYIDCKNKVLDVAWSPFNDCVLASSEDSGDINIWVIPADGLQETISVPYWELHDVHTRKVSCLQWHPSAEYIIAASGYDSFVSVWDCENQKCITEIPCGEMPTNIIWNTDGSKLAITTKENKVMSLTIVEPRSGEVLAKNPECHQGPKPTKCVFLKNGNIITIGADRQANRSIVLWNGKNITEEIFEIEIGNTGAVLNPYYDLDLGILYLFGRGESVIRYYEVQENEIYYLSSYTGTVSQKGGNFMPKRGVNTQGTEIARFYKLQPAKCEPISLIVPRKSEHFQKDLYPPCASDDPALTAAEWLSGLNKSPLMKEFEESGSSGKSKREPKTISKPMVKKALPAKSSGGGGVATPSAASNGVPEGINFAELLEDMKKVKATVRKLNKRVSKLEEKSEQQNEEQEDEEEE